MPFGQSAVAAFFVGNITKRVSFLTLQLIGHDRRKADIFSDELSISATYSVGTAISVVTVDPVGMAATVGYAAMLENEKDMKEEFFCKKNNGL